MTSVCQSPQSGRRSLPSTTILIAPAGISAVGTGVGMGVVSESVGVTPTSTGAASEKGVGVGAGVGVAVGLGATVGNGSSVGIAHLTSLRVGVTVGKGGKDWRVDIIAGGVAESEVVGVRVSSAEPDAELPLNASVPTKTKKAASSRVVTTH
jgi:hypothetical protein